MTQTTFLTAVGSEFAEETVEKCVCLNCVQVTGPQDNPTPVPGQALPAQTRQWKLISRGKVVVCLRQAASTTLATGAVQYPTMTDKLGPAVLRIPGDVSMETDMVRAQAAERATG